MKDFSRASGKMVVRWSAQSPSVGTSPGRPGSLPLRNGEDGRQVVGPVAQRRNLARQAGQLAVEKITERLARHVDILAVAEDEIHRHIEGEIHITLETEAVLEDEGQHPGAVRIQILPAMGAVGQHPGRLTLPERRVGEQRRGDRLQGQRDAQLLHHVGFGGEVEVHLHGAGAEHHMQTTAADGLHVAFHDAVAALWHYVHVVVLPDRCGAKANETGADGVGYLMHLGQVGVHFVAGLMDGLQGRAGKFQLTARLQADIGAVLLQADDVAALKDRRPAEAFAQPLQHGADRAGALVWQGRVVGQAVAELLVLGADPPRLRRRPPPCCGMDIARPRFHVIVSRPGTSPANEIRQPHVSAHVPDWRHIFASASGALNTCREDTIYKA
jgi:hypothetical protein